MTDIDRDTGSGTLELFDQPLFFVDCRERTNYLESALGCISSAITMNVPWVCAIVGSPMSGKHAFMQCLAEELRVRYPERYVTCGTVTFDVEDRIASSTHGDPGSDPDLSRKVAEEILGDIGAMDGCQLVTMSGAHYRPLVSWYILRGLLDLGYKDIIYTSQRLLDSRCTAGAVGYVAKMGPLSQQQSYNMLRRICATFRNSNITFEEFLALGTVADLSDPALVTIVSEYFRESHQVHTRDEVLAVLREWRSVTHALFGRTVRVFERLHELIPHWCMLPPYNVCPKITEMVWRVSSFLMFNNNAISVKRNVIREYLLTNFPDFQESDTQTVIEFMRDFSLAFYEDLTEGGDECGLRLAPTLTEGLRSYIVLDPARWGRTVRGASETLGKLGGDAGHRNTDVCMYLNLLDSMMCHAERCGAGGLPDIGERIDDYLDKLLRNRVFDIPLPDTIRVLSHYLTYSRGFRGSRSVCLERSIYPIVADMMAVIDCEERELQFNVDVQGILDGRDPSSPFIVQGPEDRRLAEYGLICLSIAHLGLLGKRPRLQHRSDKGGVFRGFQRCQSMIDRFSAAKYPLSKECHDVDRLQTLLYLRAGEYHLDRDPRIAEVFLDAACRLFDVKACEEDSYLGPLRHRLELNRARVNMMLRHEGFLSDDRQPVEPWALVGRILSEKTSRRGSGRTSVGSPGDMSSIRFNNARRIALDLFNEEACPVCERIMSLLLLADIEIRSHNMLEARYYLDDAYQRIFLFRFQKDNLLARFEEKCGDYDLSNGNLQNARSRYEAALRYYDQCGMFWLRAITASKIYQIDSSLNNVDEQNQYLLDEVLTFCNSELGKEYAHSHLEILRRLGGVSNTS
ncbi:MAG: hypothetical protein MJZ38_04705 [archaeon]|nr:hypothetical protein [archaeon]